jgi:hypothetical protein
MSEMAEVKSLELSEVDNGGEGFMASLSDGTYVGAKVWVAPVEPLQRAVVVFEWRGSAPQEIRGLAERIRR